MNTVETLQRIQRTFEDHLGGDGARIADRLCHCRVSVRISIGDHVNVAHLLLTIQPFDANVVSQNDQVTLSGAYSETERTGCHRQHDFQPIT